MWYLVLRREVVPRSEWTVSLDEHLEWMEREHRAGRILLSGPTPDRSMGIYVIKAESIAEAETIAAGDPFTVAGYSAPEIIEWEVHQMLGIGGFTETEQLLWRKRNGI